MDKFLIINKHSNMGKIIVFFKINQITNINIISFLFLITLLFTCSEQSLGKKFLSSEKEIE